MQEVPLSPFHCELDLPMKKDAHCKSIVSFRSRKMLLSVELSHMLPFSKN